MSERAAPANPDPSGDLLEAAWGLIANAGESDWSRESTLWQNAAMRWRDRYHEAIGATRISMLELR